MCKIRHLSRKNPRLNIRNYFDKQQQVASDHWLKTCKRKYQVKRDLQDVVNYQRLEMNIFPLNMEGIQLYILLLPSTRKRRGKNKNSDVDL